MAELTPFDQARQAVVDSVGPLPAESIGLDEACGRVLARDVNSPEDLPRFPISAMDGYAITPNTLDEIGSAGEARARVVGEIPAGVPGHDGPVGPSQCVRIFTGGVVPAWAAAVVMQEQCSREGDAVTIAGPVKPGHYIRAAGSDVVKGAGVLSRGENITPPAVGLLAALGVDMVDVGRRPSVGILVTGSEIARGPDLAPGTIRDSNGPMLESAAISCGAGTVARASSADSSDDIAMAMTRLLESSDIVCVSGGVSVGDYDLVKDVIEGLGVERVFWGVAQRPGKPFYFGMFDGRPVFGLPGNPTSSLASFVAHVRPAILGMQGAANPLATIGAVLEGEARKAAGFTALLRGTCRTENARRLVRVTGAQESHMLIPFARSNCLIVTPTEPSVVEEGTCLEIIELPWATT